MKRLFLAVLFTALLTSRGWAADTELHVTLLGTGTPAPSATRFSYSTLVEAGNQKLLFDFGRGVTIRLAQLHIPFGAVTAHFLTHFHSDHLAGLPDLWLTGWLRPPYGQRNHPFVLYGPKGTLALTHGLTEAFARDREIREADEHDPPSGIAFDVHEIEPGVVFDKEGVKVTAFANDHGPLVKPSFGYRIDYGGHSVVLSGDTRYDPAVVAAAKGADLFIHCVTLIPDALLKQNPAYEAVYHHLASPEDAGRAFAEAHPKLAVFSHIGLNGNSTVADLVAATRKTYQGPLVVGEDLMGFEIGASIAVFERAPAR